MSEETAVAVHACGFKNKNEICIIANLRIQVAAKKAYFEKTKNIIISGGPPYEKGSEPLAFLIGKKFKEHWKVQYATDCFDSSTDIQNIIRIAKEKQFSKVLAVSSYWHLWALKPLYKYWTKQMNYQGEIGTVEVDHRIDRYLTGKKTRFVYFFYACLIRLTILAHLFKYLDSFLYSTLSKRKNGYPVSGCS